MNATNNFQYAGYICSDAKVIDFKKTNMVKFGMFVGKNEGQKKSAIINVEKICKKDDKQVIDLLKKGQLVKVTGFFDSNTYTTKDGKEVTNFVLVATSVEPHTFKKKEEKKEAA